MKRDDFAGRPGDEQRDCMVRAFTVLTQRPYPEIHAAFKDAGRKNGRATPRKVSLKVADKYKVKLNYARISVARFLDDMQYVDRVVAVINGHAFAVTRGVIADYVKVKPRSIIKFFYTI